MATKYLDSTGLTYFWGKIKTWVANFVKLVVSSGTYTLTVGSTSVVVPTKTSELNNDSNFITSSDLPPGVSPSSTTPKMDGTAAVGTETAFARGDHRHPSDTSKLSEVQYSSGGFVLSYDDGISRTPFVTASTIVSDGGGVTTDTKNTAGSTNSSSKLYLIGATSQAANPQTYSHDTAYVGTDGCLYSNSSKVMTAGDIGAASGICPLDANSKVDSQYLPSYVDDVVEAYPRTGQTELSSTWLAIGSASGTVITPEAGKIYVLMTDSTSYSANSQFRWGGSAYVKMNDGGVSAITTAEIDVIVAN